MQGNFSFHNPTRLHFGKESLAKLSKRPSMHLYQNHIKTSHFQTYKQGTLHMVKSLDLVDMRQMAPECLSLIFKKAN